MTTQDTARTTIGVILAGGAGKRLGGDKTLREVAGQPLLARVTDRLLSQCTSLLISANGDAARFAEYPAAVIADTVPGQPGPLGGILAALDWVAQNSNLQWLVSAPVDCPFLPTDLVSRLHAERGDAPVAVAASGNRTHPVIGLWHVSLRADLFHALASDNVHKVGAFVARHPHRVVTWVNDPVDPFFNVNTPEDLAEAERQLAASPHFH